MVFSCGFRVTRLSSDQNVLFPSVLYIIYRTEIIRWVPNYFLVNEDNVFTALLTFHKSYRRLLLSRYLLHPSSRSVCKTCHYKFSYVPYSVSLIITIRFFTIGLQCFLILKWRLSKLFILVTINQRKSRLLSHSYYIYITKSFMYAISQRSHLEIHYQLQVLKLLRVN